MKLPKFLQRRKRAEPVQALGRDLSTPLYQALIEIRDHPKHAKKKAKLALAGPRPFRYLYRALLNIQENPENARELATAAIADAQTASRLHAALKEIADKPKEAEELARYAVVSEAMLGARKR
jgi:hypothetical protein